MSSSVDATVLRVDDIYQFETQNRVVLHNLDWRLQRLEDLNMNMYEMMQRFTENQSVDRNRFSSKLPRSSSWMEQPNLMGQEQNERRRSSVSPYDLCSSKEEPVIKPATPVDHRLRQPLNSNATTSRRPVPSRNVNQFKRRSTIHRLNSSINNESNTPRMQSNEYTSITDGRVDGFTDLHLLFSFLVIDTSTYEPRPFSPILTYSSFDDPSLILYESSKDETTAFEIEEQTHTYIGELIRKRGRQTSSGRPSHPLAATLDTYCDSDRISLLSVDMGASNMNLDQLPTSESTR